MTPVSPARIGHEWPGCFPFVDAHRTLLGSMEDGPLDLCEAVEGLRVGMAV
jgi:hypothetical protein